MTEALVEHDDGAGVDARERDDGTGVDARLQLDKAEESELGRRDIDCRDFTVPCSKPDGNLR